MMKDKTRALLPRLVLAACMTVNLHASPGPPEVKALAAAVDAHYNHLKSLQAEFTEFYRGAGIERTETGTLWLKKPGKMRWEYRSPTDKLFVSDGKDAWFYVPADRQARKTSARKLEDVLAGSGCVPDSDWGCGDAGGAAGVGRSGQRDSVGNHPRPPDCENCHPGSGRIGHGIPL
jgi:hypothetical protein